MIEQESLKRELLKEDKVRIMKRTLLGKLSLRGSISQRIKSQIELTTETGSDWHDIQALHEGIYVDQEIQRLLELPLGQIEIIQPREETDTVGIGNTITIKGRDQISLEITIGGEFDLDPEVGIYSCNSPVVKNSVGKRKGEIFQVKLPTGEIETFEIVEICKGKF